MLTTEILYVPGCPNHQPAIHRLKKVLHSQAMDFAIREIAVTNEAAAHSLHFPGSPTRRINGSDSEPGSEQSLGLSCRLYADGTGLPSEEILHRAISTAAGAARKRL